MGLMGDSFALGSNEGIVARTIFFIQVIPSILLMGLSDSRLSPVDIVCFFGFGNS